MNLFSKTLLVGLLPCAAHAQGLYSIAPNDDEASDSLPLSYTVGASFGYDDNPNPLTGGGDQESTYVSGFVQANWTSVTPQTTWDVYARLGVRYYFEDFDAPAGFSEPDQDSYDARVGVNLTHRVSERLRFSSRNFLAYETEPDYDFGIGADVRSGQYFRWSTQNSVGYRWSDRFATVTGIDFSGITYDDLDDSDYNQLTFRQQFRYRTDPATVLTAGYRYTITDSDTGDSNSHIITGGIERRISPVSAIVLRAGVQITDPDNGSNNTTPFVEAALRSQLTEQLGANVFVRYSQEDFNRGINGGIFEENQTVRVGAKLNYALSPTISLFGGLNYIYTDYDNSLNGVDEGSENIINLNAGASYQITDNLYLTGSYNYTNNDSDFDGRDYDRNRYQLGIQATF